MQRSNTSVAFTLVELLVVVSIIVVLLALLAPALDQAVYQAELAVCGARVRSIASGAIAYTGDYRRFYPRRPVIENRGLPPNGWLNIAGNAQLDDRPIFSNHIPINAGLNCPLNGLALDIAGSAATTYTYSSYDLWFGFRFEGLAGMRRLGDRLEAAHQVLTDAQGKPLIKRYGLLAADVSEVLRFAGTGTSNHPDEARHWSHMRRQDAPPPWNANIDITGAWYLGNMSRGPLDLNYAYQDGSVVRVRGVQFAPADETRMDYIPGWARPSAGEGRERQVPAE